MSSANRRMLETISLISLILSKNKRGTRIEPCGTPADIIIFHVHVSPASMYKIRTLANSALVNSNLKKSDLVKSTSITGELRLQTLFNSDLFIGQFGQIKQLVNSDLMSWSIRLFFIGQFGPFPLVI